MESITPEQRQASGSWANKILLSSNATEEERRMFETQAGAWVRNVGKVILKARVCDYDYGKALEVFFEPAYKDEADQQTNWAAFKNWWIDMYKGFGQSEKELKYLKHYIDK